MAKKTPSRKAPARKVASVHREREHKAKKHERPHVLEDSPPVQPEFDFSRLGQAKQAANPVPEPVLFCGPAEPQCEGRDSTIPSDIDISIGRCFISLRFR